MHALFFCPDTAAGWSLTGVDHKLSTARYDSDWNFIEWALDSFYDGELACFLGFLWAAWAYRNEWIIKGNRPILVSMMKGYAQISLEYNVAAAQKTHAQTSLHRTPSFEEWEPPPPNMIKINTDAAMFDQNEVGMGCVFQNEKGEILAVASKRIRVSWKADVAEMAAARYGTLMAKKLGYQNVVIETDALNVISALQIKTPFFNS